VVVPETLNPEPGTRNPEPGTPYAIYNIGNSSPVQLSDFITAIEQNLGKTAIRENRPMQPGDVPYTEADVTDLIKNLDYKPNTPVATGIKEFIDWYQMYFKA
jgi:UDP-glucuronate 4-epimerase